MPKAQEIKQQLLQRMMPPNNESISKISKDSGISETALYKWRKEITRDARRQSQANKLSVSEQQKNNEVINNRNSNAYNPHQIVPRLADLNLSSIGVCLLSRYASYPGSPMKGSTLLYKLNQRIARLEWRDMANTCHLIRLTAATYVICAISAILKM